MYYKRRKKKGSDLYRELEILRFKKKEGFFEFRIMNRSVCPYRAKKEEDENRTNKKKKKTFYILLNK